MEIYGYDQNNGCLNSFFLIILSTFGAFYKITEIKLIKAYFSHTCCPKNERSSWSAFSECLIKMLGLLMLSILGAFFKNWYTKLIKGYFNHTGCPKKWKWAGKKMDLYGHNQNMGSPKKFLLCDVEHSKSLFSNMNKPKIENGLILVKKWIYMDLIKILGHLKSFVLVMLNILGVFLKLIVQTNYSWFQPYNVCKKWKWAYFGAKIKIYGYDWNIGSLENFYFYEEHFRRLFFKNEYT